METKSAEKINSSKIWIKLKIHLIAAIIISSIMLYFTYNIGNSTAPLNILSLHGYCCHKKTKKNTKFETNENKKKLLSNVAGLCVLIRRRMNKSLLFLLLCSIIVFVLPVKLLHSLIDDFAEMTAMLSHNVCSLPNYAMNAVHVDTLAIDTVYLL